MMLLSRIAITWRISILVGLAVAGFAVIGGYYVFSAQTVAEATDRAQSAERILAEAGAFDRRVLRKQVQVNSYLATREPTIAADYRTTHAETLAGIATLESLVAGTDLAAVVAELRDDLEAHTAIFEQMIQAVNALGVTEDDGLRGALKTAAENIDGQLTELERKSIGMTLDQTNALILRMAIVRSGEKSLIMDRDADMWLPQIEDGIARFRQELRFASFFDEVKTGLSDGIDAYETHVRGYAAGEADLAAVIENSNRLFSALEPRLAGLSDTAATRRSDAVLEAQKATASFETTLMIVGLILIAVIVSMGAMIGRSVISPLKSLVRDMGRIADGNLDLHVRGTELTDEIGTMAQSLEIFQDGMIEQRRLEAERKEIEERSLAERRRALTDMATTIETETLWVVDNVAERADSLNRSALTVSDTTASASANAQDVADSATQSQQNAQTVATAAKALNASIEEMVRQVGEQSVIAQSAADEADQTSDTVDGLNNAANKIGAVVDLIRDIAEQTNLLALNATIEAARAGDAGKGFAVVAGEVKNLATQTAKATEDITTLVTGMQGIAGDVVSAIGSIGATIKRMNEISASVAQGMKEQGNATREIAANIGETTRATEVVSDKIGQVSSEAAETGETAKQLQFVARDMSRQVAELRETLTRIVHTATNDTERREDNRYEVKFVATLISGTSRTEAALLNVSLQGLAVKPPSDADIDLSDGVHVIVGVDGLAAALEAEVVSTDDRGRVHLRHGGTSAAADQLYKMARETGAVEADGADAPIAIAFPAETATDIAAQ